MNTRNETTRWQGKVRRIRFSNQEFSAFVAAQADRAKVHWLALSGDILPSTDAAELERLLIAFFNERGTK